MKTIALADYEDPGSLGSRFRVKRMAPLIDLMDRVYEENGSINVLDVGGRRAYWMALPEGFLRDKKVTVTILNLASDLQGEDDSMFKHVLGDACKMTEFTDDQFDIVHSNSVIEHVGNWDKIKEFAEEVRRVAPNLFVQTPYFWFPIEPHFIKLAHHWLPKPLRMAMWLRFKMGQRGMASNIDEAMSRLDEEPYLLDMRMYRFLFPDCRIIRERFFLLTKSMVAFRERANGVRP